MWIACITALFASAHGSLDTVLADLKGKNDVDCDTVCSALGKDYEGYGMSSNDEVRTYTCTCSGDKVRVACKPGSFHKVFDSCTEPVAPAAGGGTGDEDEDDHDEHGDDDDAGKVPGKGGGKGGEDEDDHEHGDDDDDDAGKGPGKGGGKGGEDEDEDEDDHDEHRDDDDDDDAGKGPGKGGGKGGEDEDDHDEHGDDDVDDAGKGPGKGGGKGGEDEDDHDEHGDDDDDAGKGPGKGGGKVVGLSASVPGAAISSSPFASFVPVAAAVLMVGALLGMMAMRRARADQRGAEMDGMALVGESTE